MRAGFAFLALFSATTAFAAPPPGHPGAEQAIELLGASSDPARPVAALPHAGVVRNARESNSFTYIEVEYVAADGQPASRWIAAPKMVIAPGDRLRFDDGRRLVNFYSRKHGITFESITFVGRAVRVTDGQP